MKKLLAVLLTSLLTFSSFLSYSNTTLPVTLKHPIEQAVSINQADLATLMTLKGIGAKKAEAIIAYREQHGSFSSLDELLNVKGIGKKLLENNQARLNL